jgi:O-antigen/teichoic acid export membrane protein
LKVQENLLPSVRVARGATAVFIKSIASAPIYLLYVAILTRLIPPNELGVLAILTFFTTILSAVGSLGLSWASSKFIPELLGRGEVFKALAVYRKIFLLGFVSAITISIIILPISPYLNLFLTRTSEYLFLMILAIISIPLTILFNIFLSLIQSFQRMKEYAVASFTQLNLGRFLGLALLALGLGLAGIFYATIAATFLAIIISIPILRRRLKAYNINPYDPPQDFPTIKLLSFSFPLLGVGLLGILLDWIDSVFIWAKLSFSELGIYQAAILIYSFLLLPLIALYTSLYPQLSELYGKNGKESLSEAFKITSRYVSLAFIPLIFVSILFSREIISILTGPQYSEATIPFAIMAFGAFAAGFTLILSLYFMTLEKTKQLLGLQALSFVVYLSMLSFLVSMLGIEGAAISKAFTASFTMLITFLILKKYIKVCFDSEGFLKSIVSSLIASALILPFLMFYSSLTLFPLQLSLFAVIYLFVLIALKSFHNYDLERLEAFLPSRMKFLANLLRRFVK